MKLSSHVNKDHTVVRMYALDIDSGIFKEMMQCTMIESCLWTVPGCCQWLDLRGECCRTDRQESSRTAAT